MVPVHDPASARVTLRRGVNRGSYEPDTIRRILEDGLIAHVGVLTNDGPLVLPMAYGLGTRPHGEEVLYLHGAVANGMLNSGAGGEVCATVTIVDGLVVARTPLHDSMNYRCVVVRGFASRVTDDDEHRAGLRSITDHVAANWDGGRPPSTGDLRRTMVLALPIREASAKIRSGDPVDEPDDLAGPHWAGTVPVRSRWGAPRPSLDLASATATPPPAVAALEGTAVEGRQVV